MARRLGVTRFVDGWLDTYAKGVARRVKEGTGSDLNRSPIYGVGTTEYMRSVGGYAVTLECGQHDDPSSVDLLTARSTTSSRISGSRRSRAAEGRTLRSAAPRRGDRSPPRRRQLQQAWSSFDRLTKGELIGTRHDGTPVTAPMDGWIVFRTRSRCPGTSGSTWPSR